jgi:eukaryotic-like serine/threonine-protein kinase
VAEEIIEGYRVVNTLATGQNSQVLEVVEVSSHRHFAMKILLPEKYNDSAAKNMLTYEAEVGKELMHPNVVRIHGVGKDSKHHNIPFFTMEFFPAGSLKLRIQRKQMDYIVANASSILKQSATALAYMNTSGWVHRDIKPENMLINSAGNLKIIDFALAKRIESPSFFSRLFRRKAKFVQGTRTYMSPEQILGETLDARSDIYNYGITAYEMVALRPPFRAATQRELLSKHLHEVPPSPQTYNADITDDFGKLAQRMVAKKPADRPQSFHEILKVLNVIRVFKTEPPPKPSEQH